MRELGVMLLTIIFLNVAITLPASAISREVANREVLQAVEFLKSQHPDPYWHTSQDKFNFVVNSVLNAEGELSAAEHYFNLAEIYGMVFDTHTQLYPSLEEPIVERTYPIRVRLFSEGLFVVAADDPYRDLVGKRIVEIGGRKTEGVINTLTKHSFSENHYRKRVFAEMFFYWPEMYKVFGFSELDGSVQLIIEDVNGAQSPAALTQTQAVSFAKRFREDYTATGTDPIPDGWTSLTDIFEFSPPLYLRNLDKNYSYSYLADEKTMYVQINRPDNQSPTDTALDFNLEWFQVLRNSDVERFILDIRNNPGGWINVADPIPTLLSAYRLDDQNLRTYVVLVGTDSVSAASIAAAKMEYELSSTITIGQPTGSGPNLFLNSSEMMLPHSKIELEVSTAVMPFRSVDDRMFIAPDIWVPYSFFDYISGKDPVLDAALAVTGEVRDGFHADRLPMQGWTRKSQNVAVPRLHR